MNDIPNKNQRLLRKKSLAFSGAITASISHELKNVLAIINEHNGLLSDILESAKQGVSPDERKLSRIAGKVNVQIEKGNELIGRLNRFAHSTDFETKEVELNDLLQEIIDLAQRLAGLRTIQLKLNPPVEKIALNTNPFFLQYALFICFELFWDIAEKNRLVTVSAESSGQQAKIIISGVAIADLDKSCDQRNTLTALLKELKGNVEYGVGENNMQFIELLIPSMK
jgi:signal transduction histidine kinase